MKLIKSIFGLLVAGLVMQGCTDELEKLNDNPNQPENVSTDVLMVAGTRASMNSMATESFLLSNNVAQITAKTLRTEVDVYNWNAFSTLWQNQYQALTDLVDAANQASNEGDNATLGASLVLQSWIFSNLTMAYGDIPYSEAVRSAQTGNFTPVYGKQEEILDGPDGILSTLDEAVNLLQGASGSVNGDIIYDGNTSQWVKLANGLRLRILLHLSNKRDVSADMAAIASSGNLLGEGDDATLNYLGSFPNEFPLFPLKQGDFDAVVMSEAAVGVMQNYGDPRLGRYARPDNINELVDSLGTFNDTAAVYSGANNGSENADVCNKSGSRLGLRYYDYPGQPTGDNRANGIIMTYAEQELILAEAAEKGFIGASAGVHYENGIEASMNYYGVNYPAFGYTDFQDYYANSGVQYNNDLNQIWEQKWLAVFFHGMEPMFEVRRMVYEQNGGANFDVSQVPFLNAPCQNVNGGEMPIRFLYPGEEQTLNSENYQDAVNRLGSNGQNERMWLMQQ